MTTFITRTPEEQARYDRMADLLINQSRTFRRMLVAERAGSPLLRAWARAHNKINKVLEAERRCVSARKEE